MSLGNVAGSRLRVALLLAALITVAYGGSLRNEFVFDDLMIIKDDPRVRSLRETPRLFVEPLWGYADEAAGQRLLHQYYRPLQTVPLALTYAAVGPVAWPCHLLGLVLHFINCLLVFEILRRVIGAAAPAAAAVMLYAVHPGYSEAVLWISDLAGLGAACCNLAIFVLHLSGVTKRWAGRLAMAALFLVGLWFKESGVLAPVLLVTYDLLLAPDRGPRRVARMLGLYVVFVAPFALYVYLRLHALGGAVPGLESVPLTRLELLLNAVALIPKYVATFVWPFDPNMYHDFSIIHDARAAAFTFGSAVLAAGAFIFMFSVWTHPSIAFGLAWALLTAAPYLLIRWPQLNVFAERYLYLPAIGIFLVLGYIYVGVTCSADAARAPAGLPGRSMAKRGAWSVAYGAVLLAFVITDIRRTQDWHDEVTLYGKTVTQSPRAALVRNNLAVKLLELGRYDEGIALLEELVVSDPDWHDVWYNLGLLYLGKGEDDKALPAFQRAWATDSNNHRALLNMGYLYDRAGRREEAVEAYLHLVELEPRNTQGWYNLAVIASEGHQTRNARTALEHVLAITPNDADAGTLRQRLDRVRQPEPSMASTPSADTVRRCNAAKAAMEERRHAEAIRTLKMAAWLDEASPLPHQYLANLYFLVGRLALAVAEQREALQRAPQNDLYRSNLASLEKALAAKKEATAGAADAD